VGCASSQGARESTMGFRFRKSVRFGRLVRLNFSGSGVSLGLGPPGANVNIGRRGIRRTIGIPGTGLSYQSFSSWQSQPSSDGQLPPQSALPNESAVAPDPPEPSTARTLLRIGIIAIVLLGLIGLIRLSSTSRPAPSVASSQPERQTTPPASVSQPPVNDLQVEDPRPLATEEVPEVQNRLKTLGFDPGSIDGLNRPGFSGGCFV
jgi:hypothetical protein